MAKECFCGCGRTVPFGRKRFANALGRQFDKDLALFAGAIDAEDDPSHRAELSDLVATGRPLRDQLRDIVHGTFDRKDYDREAGKKWLERANDHRGRLAEETAAGDYAGWNALRQAQLIHAGRHAPGTIVDVQDTGTTINDNPRVRLLVRVEPPGEEPFELERNVLVSRVAIPRRGERIDVAYDPDDHSRFTFRMADLTDDAAAPPPASPAGDPVDQLERLARLRETGALTAEEFEEAKRRILSG